jgi:hypothetical protein
MTVALSRKRRRIIMIECRSCRGLFRVAADKVGARCPRCHMPLFERSERLSPRDSGLGTCPQHAGAVGVAVCQQCARPMCVACRTRWFGLMMCPACVEAALSSDEPNPRELRRLSARAAWSFVLALVGWIIAALVLLLLLVQHRASSGNVTLALVLGVFSMIPAAFAVGQGCAVVLVRGPRDRLAATGMVMSGAHLGLLLGLFLINLWHN